MSIKEIIKSNGFLCRIYSLFSQLINNKYHLLRQYNRYYIKRLKKNAGFMKKTQKSDLSYIIWSYHVIEKGLTMPNRKLGFGFNRLIDLIHAIRSYVARYSCDSNNKQLFFAASVVFSYEKIHNENCFSLPVELVDEIKIIHSMFPRVKPHDEIEFSSKGFFENNDNCFPTFSSARHSVRDFSNEAIPLDDIIEAIKLAKDCPSACNRQPTKVHIVTKSEQIEFCLERQNGNRGFGKFANKLLIVTADVRTLLGSQELFDLFTNAGIFIMNLSYSLQYKKIGSCILNWYSPIKCDKQIRKELNIPENEVIVSFIVCGKVKEHFMVADSLRYDVSEIIKIH